MTLTAQKLLTKFWTDAEDLRQISWKFYFYFSRNYIERHERTNKQTNQRTTKHVRAQYILAEVINE